jgi:hypothetical protein
MADAAAQEYSTCLSRIGPQKQKFESKKIVRIATRCKIDFVRTHYLGPAEIGIVLKSGDPKMTVSMTGDDIFQLS